MTELTFACSQKYFSRIIGWEKKISQATREEDNLLFQSEDELLIMARQKRVILVLRGGDIIGSIVLRDIKGGWNEVGTVYIFPQYQNQGIGQALLKYALKSWNGGRKVMSTSKNPSFVHLAIKAGMIPVYSCGGMKSSIRYTCVCGELDGVLDPESCSSRGGKCIFLISQATAKLIGNYTRREDELIQSIMDFSQ